MKTRPTKTALIVVDLQNDFLPGGALAVRGGDETVSVANQAMDLYDLVVATQDWHPADHGSFASQHHGRKPGELIQLEGLTQVLWPDHCVQQTRGAEFAKGLRVTDCDAVFPKGTRRGVDSYSGFFDNGKRHGTGLVEWLRAAQVKRVGVLGLATDYCVKFTALDAIAEGFETELILEGCRGVDLQPGDSDRAVQEMLDRGIRVWKTLDARRSV